MTAIGGSGTGLGVAVSSCFGQRQRATLVNVIARAGGDDVVASEQCDLGGGPPDVAVDVQTSNAEELVEKSGAQIDDLGGNQTMAPRFVAASAGDFRQAAGSPTIDAGTDMGRAGAFDLDLEPRLLGARPDIGADERPSPPQAITGVATRIDATGATLAGTVNPGGVPCTSRFQYGPTTAYGSSTPTASAAAGAVSARVTGLRPGTVYHYRIVAINSAGTTAGADATFTTAPAAADAGEDADPPVLDRLSMTRRRFAVAAPGRRGRARLGTAFRFRLSEDARVTIAIQRARRGHRTGKGRCSPRARRGRRCTAYRRAGRLVRPLAAGSARVAFSGRLGRRTLKRGRYRATVRAVDAAGNAGTARRIGFTVVRRY